MANNFDDSRIIDFWRFENNLLAGKNGNDLTASAGGVGYLADFPRAGETGLDLERSSVQFAKRLDADLSPGFILKSGDTVKKGSIAFWFKPESVVFGYGHHLVHKSAYESGKYSLYVLLWNSGVDITLRIVWGYGSGTSTEEWTVAAVTVGTDYHCGIAFDGVAKTCLVRLWDGAAAATYTHDYANEMNVGDGAFRIGTSPSEQSTRCYDGLKGELVVANDLFSADEFDEIRNGTFGPVPLEIRPTGIPSREAFGAATIVFNPDNFAVEAAKLHGAQPVPIFTIYLDKMVTDWKSPGTCATVDRDGKDAWVDPDNAKAEDGTAAKVNFTGDSYSDWLRLSNFGFTVDDLPAGTIPVGIEFEIVRSASRSVMIAADEIRDSAIYARKTSGQVGNNQADTSVYWPSSNEPKVYGGSADLLGEVSWALADIVDNADFGFDISAETTNYLFATAAALDYFRVRIHYRFVGILDTYEVPGEDVLNAGTLLWSKAVDFSDLTPSDHTLTVLNVDGKYTPGHPNFIFALDPQYYYRRYLKIELGYRVPGTKIIYKQVIYRGQIQDWGPAEFPEVDTQDAPAAEIYTQDLISSLLEQAVIGNPDDEGNPRPLVYGQVMAPADQVADANPDTPAKTAFFEGGAVTGGDAFDSVTEDAGGAVDIDSVNPYGGAYCAYARVSGANQTAYGHLGLAAQSDIIHCRFRMRLSEIPVSTEAGNCLFMEILNNNGNLVASLEVRSVFKVRLNVKRTSGWAHKEIDWLLNSYQNTYCRVSVVLNRTDDYVQVYLDNSCVFNWDLGGTLEGDYQTLKVGFATGGTAETWSAYFDNLEIWNSFYRFLFQIPGSGGCLSIDGVWVDGAIVYYSEPSTRRKRYRRKHWLHKRYGRGRPPNSELITYYPAFRGVGFAESEMSGEVFILATKDSISHPVDVLTAIFTDAGGIEYIDAPSFAAAKAATPDYMVGCMFENCTALDAVIEVCSKALYDISLQIPVRLIPYQGAAPASVKTLTDADILTLNSTDQPRKVVNKLVTRYGWYEHDDRSKIESKDLTSIKFLGEKLAELSLEWGEAVATNSRLMAQTVTDLLKVRLGRAPREVNSTGLIGLATLLLGEGVTLNSAALGRPADVYELTELTIDLQDMRTEQKLLCFAIPA
jgi:hypothetical protein